MICIVPSLLWMTTAIVNSVSKVKAESITRVNNGTPAEIIDYGHSVFISVVRDDEAFFCGASVLNQEILLTAAHCFDSVTICSIATAFAGHENHELGQRRKIIATHPHNQFARELLSNDIALALLNSPFILGDSVQRISLCQSFDGGYGEVAGWGIIDAVREKRTILLHWANQYLLPRSICLQIAKNVPEGTICGLRISDTAHPSRGDSGSALVKYGFMQVGIVSHKNPEIKSGLTVYTDISYFHHWITMNARKLYCSYGL